MEKENVSLNIPAETVTNVHQYKHVMIHIETTGFEKQADIIKISALSGTDNFMTYITPTSQYISPQVSRENDFKVIERKLCFRGQPVDEGPPQERLIRLQKWLEGFGTPVVLVGHSCRSFIAPRLMYNLIKHGLEERFRAVVVGFIDSLKLSKTVFPSAKRYTLKNLARNILGIPFEAHSGLENVKILQKLMVKARDKPQTAAPNFDKFSFSFSFSLKKAENSVSYKRAANSQTKPALKPAKRRA